MTTPTHADMVAAVDKGRAEDVPRIVVTPTNWRDERNTHADTLAALLALHKPQDPEARLCAECVWQRWPCSTVAIVIDVCRGWGRCE